jgi:hypothetical protein
MIIAQNGDTIEWYQNGKKQSEKVKEVKSIFRLYVTESNCLVEFNNAKIIVCTAKTLLSQYE